MSKSYGNTILLSDPEPDIRAKLKTMVTDPARIRRTDPGNPDVCPVYDLLTKVFSSDDKPSSEGLGKAVPPPESAASSARSWLADANVVTRPRPHSGTPPPIRSPPRRGRRHTRSRQRPRQRPRQPDHERSPLRHGPQVTVMPKETTKPAEDLVLEPQPIPQDPEPQTSDRRKRRSVSIPLLRNRRSGLRRPPRPPPRPDTQAEHRHLRHPHRPHHQPVPRVHQPPPADRRLQRRRVYLRRLAPSSTSSRRRPPAPRDPLRRRRRLPEDPRRELVERLLEHERFKAAAQMLLQKQHVEEATWTTTGLRNFLRDAGGSRANSRPRRRRPRMLAADTTSTSSASSERSSTASAPVPSSMSTKRPSPSPR